MGRAGLVETGNGFALEDDFFRVDLAYGVRRRCFMMKRLTFSALCLVLLSAQLDAQDAQPKGLQPTHKDVAYADEDPAQILDAYLVESDTPVPVMVHIHGGGWRAGSKNSIPQFLAQAYKEGWLSVISVEYRFTDVKTHPAQVQDCQRAIQFVRSKAKEWNLDPNRIGTTGGSAGAHLSLWLGMQDDAAQPDAEDPVARESSRVALAIGFAGPTDWSLLSDIEHKHPAYRQLLGYEPGTPAAEMSAELKADVSPVTFVSPDDPPVLMVHGDADDVVPIQHSQVLLDKLKEAGVTAELVVIPEGLHNVAGGRDADRAVAFIKERFRKDANPAP